MKKWFILRTTERIYPAIRNIIFAFIIGLSSSAVVILIKDREKYIEAFKNKNKNLRWDR